MDGRVLYDRRPVRTRALLIAAFAVLLAAPPAAAQTVLNAEVSGALTIWLRQGGVDVTHLSPGSYTVNVNDASDQHNFRLTAPSGLELRTDIWTVDPQTWTGLGFVDGLYHFNCEHHAQMFGDFTVGNVIWLEATGLGTGKVTSAPSGVNWPQNRGAPFSPGSQVTLTATPDAGSKFVGWSGGACSGTGDCTVTVNGRVNVVAQFTPALSGGTTASAGITRVAVAKTRSGRVVRATLNVRRQTAVTAQLRKNARIIVSKSQLLAPGTRVVRLAVPRKTKAGSYTLRLRFRDVAAGTTVTVNRAVRMPR
jgi:hypothetical protein